MVLKPAQGSVFFFSVLEPTRGSKKYVFCHTAPTAATSARYTNQSVYGPLSRESWVPRLRVVGHLCVEVSIGV